MGRSHPIIASWLINLANLLEGTDRFADGELLYREALEIFSQTLGQEHLRTGRAQRNFASALLAHGRAEEALHYAQSALAAQEHAHGPDNRFTRNSARVCADALAALGRSEEATALLSHYDLTLPTRQGA